MSFILGQTEYKCGDIEQCLKLFDEAIELDPSNLAVKFQKGVVLEENEDIEGALKCFHEVSGPVPEEPSAKFMEGKLALSEGNVSDGVRLLVDSLTLGYPNKDEVYSELCCVVDELIDDILKS